MLNFKIFLKKNDIEFDTDKKAIRWIRSLKPKGFVRIGSSYFIDEDEANQLMQDYLHKQIVLRKKRAIQAKKNFLRNTLYLYLLLMRVKRQLMKLYGVWIQIELQIQLMTFV